MCVVIGLLSRTCVTSGAYRRRAILRCMTRVVTSKLLLDGFVVIFIVRCSVVRWGSLLTIMLGVTLQLTR